ncbi:MAG: hypothetical protein WA975_05060 [Mesorhizobium sp.]
MLQLSPELLAYLRSIQVATDAKVAAVAERAGIEKRSARKLNRARRQHLIDRAAVILREGEPSKFQFEAACRHGFRSSFCLQGWSWTDADQAAADVVAAALLLVGAERPTWQEGQPEWTQDGVLRVERDNCIRCRGPLPDGHHKFCCVDCGRAHREAMARQADNAAANARLYAYYAAWSARQAEQSCALCDAKFRPNRPQQRFCSVQCRNIHNSGLVRVGRRRTKCEADK